MKFYLIVATGKRQGEPIPIEVDLFLIGSGRSCQLKAMHEQIGEQHCALVTRERKVFVQDLDSGHPTRVNYEEIPAGEEWPLHAGDLLEVGPLHFMIQFHEHPLSRRDLEEWAIGCLDLVNNRHITAMDRLDAVSAEKIDREDASSVAGAILDYLSVKRGVVKGRLRIAREGAFTIVRVNDVHLVQDAELAIIKKELHDNLNRPHLKVLLDLKNVRRMSSSAAEMLGDLQKWLRGNGCKFAMCRVKPELSSMLHDLPSGAGGYYSAPLPEPARSPRF
ncbi:MAG: FHA domain-containing protein [Planctomycetes bacterium]|nr:FHA domain-containing protein [Planctomycetota bacterium]